MDIILSTRNPGKAEQIKALFADSAFNIITLDDAGIEGEVVEDGATLEENSLKKAVFAHEKAPSMWSMADDTGFFIDALHGEPGIQAAHWGGANISGEERMCFALKQMEGVADRSATFRTCVALISPEGDERFFIGEVKGEILKSPRGTLHPKLPYDQIFMPDESDKAFAEMEITEQNNISQRGRAFAQVRSFLEKGRTR
jgi:XTP/dITP diphosphohydrolase